jgi:hypothetical protein
MTDPVTLLESPGALADWLDERNGGDLWSYAGLPGCQAKYDQAIQHLRDYQALVDALRTARQCPMSQPKE